jgi:alcohol dehydrogenase class IV
MGPGALNGLDDEVKALKANKVLIVTDQGLIEAGLVKKVQDLLEKADIKYAVFGGVEADPRYEIVSDCVEMIRRENADLIIGFGGGSPIDIAKVSAVMAKNEGPISEYFGIDLIPRAGLSTLIIPTTAGTGSEVTPIAILSDHTEKLKKGIVSHHLFPSAALLDPELTLGLPAHVTAATGMDALIHAVESFTSKNATSITDMLARQTMRLIAKNIRTAYSDGVNLDARSNMYTPLRIRSVPSFISHTVWPTASCWHRSWSLIKWVIRQNLPGLHNISARTPPVFPSAKLRRRLWQPCAI